MKKYFAFLLCLVMCIPLFTGCAKTTTNDSSSKEESATPQESTTVTTALTNAERYPLESSKTYNVWVNDIAGDTDNLNSKYYMQLWESVTGVSINATNMYDTALSSAFASGTFPDATFSTWGLDKNTIYEYGQEGLLVNFMDYLDLMPNFARLIEEYPSMLYCCQNEDGSVYSLPKFGLAPGASSQLLYLRTDMLHAAGWEEAPQTADEFLQCIKDIQAVYGANDPDFVAFHVGDGERLAWNDRLVLAYFFPTFGDLIETGLTNDANGNVVLGAADEQYKHLMEFMAEIYNSGAFPQDIYTTDTATQKALWTGNHIAITTAVNGTAITADNFESGQIEMIVMEPLTSEYNSEKRYAQFAAGTWVVSTINASLPEEDIKILVQWFDSFYAQEDDPLNEEGTISGMSVFVGEYGVDYTLSDDGNTLITLVHDGYETASEWQNNECYSSVMCPYLYTADPSTAFGIKGTGTKSNLWTYAVDRSAVQYAPLSQDEIDIYNDHWTDIDTYIAQMTAKWITGAEDIDATWDTYLSTLNKMGLQDVLDVYQAAYDRMS